MPWQVPERWRLPGNAEVIAVLEDGQLSAHSDVAEELARAAEGLPDVTRWCPDPAGYSAEVLVAAGGRIFGVASGMSGLDFRLPSNLRDAALNDGATLSPTLGPAWFRFDPFQPDVPQEQIRARLRHWCRVAHAGASGP